ncbi:MAG: PorT family protein [Saprospiraceae bacterium]|nr:PorT family protein [Saprospiraceae bacterium]
MQANKWDDNYRDFAWTEMEKLLQEELPVRALPWWRRIGLVFLIPFAATILLGGAFWGFSTLGPNATSSDKALPVALETDVNKQKKEQNLVENGTPAIILDQLPGKDSKPKSENRTPVTLPVTPIETENQLLIDEPTLDKPQVLYEDPVLDTQDRSVVDPLEMLPLEYFNPSGAAKAVQASYETPAPARSALQLGFTSALNVSQLPGVSAGLVVQKQIGRSRFSWQSGLEAGFQTSKPFQVLAAADNSESLDVNGDTTSVTVSPNGTNEISLGSAEKVYYLSLEMPLMLKYRISPRLNLSLGARAAYVLKGNPAFRGLFKQESGQMDSYIYGESRFGFPSQVESATEIQRNPFGLSGVAGLEYQLSSNFSVSGAFQYGLTDEFPADPEIKRRVGGEVRVNWFFNHPTR